MILALAAEGAADAWIVQQVTDRLLLEVEWIDEGSLDHHRCWRSFDSSEWVALKTVHRRCKERFESNFRLSGHFDDRPGGADALLMRKLFAWMRSEQECPDVLVVARDLDSEAGRRDGFEAAKVEAEKGGCPFAIVPALAQPEQEAWLVCAWQPESDLESERHEELRRELGHCPVAQSHRLTSTSDSIRDAKDVLDRLTRGGRTGRERFESRSLREIQESGAENGLREFVMAYRHALHVHLNYRRPI